MQFKKTQISLKLSNEEKKSITYIYDINNDKGHYKRPGIYIILAKAGTDQYTPLYVGKAGRGVNKRFREHKAGYERLKGQGVRSRGIQKLIEKCDIHNTQELEVWFRPSSTINPHRTFFPDNTASLPSTKDVWISSYSLEEEALIALFNSLGVELINSSIPTLFEGASKSPQETRTPKLEFWEKYLGQLKDDPVCKDWSDDIISRIDTALQTLENEGFINDRHTAKSVGAYSSGPFRNRSVIAFGELGNAKFKPHSVILLISNDGLFLAKNPFNQDSLEVIPTEDFTALP